MYMPTGFGILALMPVAGPSAVCACQHCAAVNQPSPKASAVFHEMMRAVHAAQTLILQQCGTLTTLVLTLVLRVQDR